MRNMVESTTSNTTLILITVVFALLWIPAYFVLTIGLKYNTDENIKIVEKYDILSKDFIKFSHEYAKLEYDYNKLQFEFMKYKININDNYIQLTPRIKNLISAYNNSKIKIVGDNNVPSTKEN